jgi:hypothetical protein
MSTTRASTAKGKRKPSGVHTPTLALMLFTHFVANALHLFEAALSHLSCLQRGPSSVPPIWMPRVFVACPFWADELTESVCCIYDVCVCVCMYLHLPTRTRTHTHVYIVVGSRCFRRCGPQYRLRIFDTGECPYFDTGCKGPRLSALSLITSINIYIHSRILDTGECPYTCRQLLSPPLLFPLSSPSSPPLSPLLHATCRHNLKPSPWRTLNTRLVNIRAFSKICFTNTSQKISYMGIHIY